MTLAERIILHYKMSTMTNAKFKEKETVHTFITRKQMTWINSSRKKRLCTQLLRESKWPGLIAMLKFTLR